MRWNGQLWWGALLACLSLPVHADDQSAAFNDAKAYAQGTVDGTGAVVSADQAAAMPYYTTNSPMPDLVPGNTGLNSVGVGKISGCVGQADTECAAVNFLAKNPDQRLKFNIDPTKDQTLQAAKQVQTDPLAVAGNALNGTESACTTSTVTTPAQYTTQTCTSLKEVASQQCTAGRQVNISENANFQCNQTTNAYQTLTCQRSPQVSVNISQTCTPGQEITEFQHSNTLNQDPCKGGDKLVFGYLCAITDTPQINLYILEGNPSTVTTGGNNWAGLNMPLNFSNTAIYFSNCKAVLNGATSCAGGACSGAYSAAIYYQSTIAATCTQPTCDFFGNCSGGDCSCPDGSAPFANFFGNMSCNAYTYSGTLNTNAAFNTYNANISVGIIQDGCASLEARAQ